MLLLVSAPNISTLAMLSFSLTAEKRSKKHNFKSIKNNSIFSTPQCPTVLAQNISQFLLATFKQWDFLLINELCHC